MKTMIKKDIFFAVTGDIIESRQIRRRSSFQDKLFLICEEANKKFGQFISIGFSITIGDEIQGLLKAKSPVFDIVDYFEQEIYPEKMRFGVGEGKVSTAFEKTTSRMDGECFLKSRQALQEAEKENRMFKIILRNKSLESALDIVLLWVEKNKEDWTDLNYRRFFLYKKLGSIEKVAKKEGVTKQSMGKSLKRSKYDLVLKSEEVLNRVLSAENG
jgi:hypothetical protein